MTLNNLGAGKKGRVVKVGGDREFKRRLLEMGITPQTEIAVVKTAPMGDPVELRLRGYALSLRLTDAEKIIIEETE